MPDKPEKTLDHRGRSVDAEMATCATPEQVYEAWANPEKISQWFTDRAEGQAEPGATLTWIFDKFNHRIPYQVVAAEPGKRFAVGCAPPPGRPAGLLEVTIERQGGATIVRLVNSGFLDGAEWDEEFQGIDSGWRIALATLKHYLENYYGKPRSSFLAMRPAVFTYEKLLPFHRTAQGLAEWLTTGGGFRAAGDTLRLPLRGGGIVSGQVLELTRTETLLSWMEIQGVLALKAFNMGQQKLVAVHGCGWGLSSARAQEIEQQMERALESLSQALAASS